MTITSGSIFYISDTEDYGTRSNRANTLSSYFEANKKVFLNSKLYLTIRARNNSHWLMTYIVSKVYIVLSYFNPLVESSRKIIVS
uniref:Uncharacterized protein n=1 Tax=Strigamia maritima TaxID=126957 RepID=T1IRD4_STRMM